MPSNQWIVKREHEELGNSIKEMINNASIEELGIWVKKLIISLEILERDGKFSKEGIRALESLVKLVNQLLENKIIGEKQHENA
tara:strand:+ start:793 stop:1044 length:252 start_codon:yes stop_codon:yes gene_type:complete